MKQTQNTLPTLNEKVKKKLEARAIQKRNIESDELEREIYDDNLERKSKPVVQAIKASTATQAMIPTVQMMRVQQAAQQLAPPSLTQDGNRDAAEAALTAKHSTSGAKGTHASADEPWIQKLYRKYHNYTKCKTTQFEIAEKGVLGLYGQVELLFCVMKIFGISEYQEKQIYMKASFLFD